MEKNNSELKACDFDALSSVTGNVYESVLAVSQRSSKLVDSAKMAFRAELEELNIKEDADHQNLLDSDIQELVSKRYEMTRKPLLVALDELLDKKITVTYQDDSLLG